VQTQDGGQNWQDAPDLSLLNPDSSIAGLGVSPGHMVLAHNSSPQSRVALDLSQSADGQAWTLVQQLAHGTGGDEFSYPALAWDNDSLWVSYTDQRQRISWQRFGVSP
jgi:predicted neuraminidase